MWVAQAAQVTKGAEVAAQDPMHKADRVVAQMSARMADTQLIITVLFTACQLVILLPTLIVLHCRILHITKRLPNKTIPRSVEIVN